MALIHKLSENVIAKIAAGEVIERPASVVKELVENALDARASHVHVDLSAGGRQMIRVADDGVGMVVEDALLAAERHATSKMSNPTDLFTIETLGFRGEALASIASVSRLEIETRHSSDEGGSRIAVEGGVFTQAGSVARAVGTTVTARSLFFNTPARRKFLRHMDTEARYIAQTISQLAVAHPQTAFEMVHNERPVLDFRVGERRRRAAEVLGVDPGLLLHARGQEGPVNVEVLVGAPEVCRRSRNRQFSVVRNRPVRHRRLNSAVYDAFGSLLPHNAHPVFVMWLDMDPRSVDVNVHPTKREVHFASERDLASTIQSVVRQALAVPEASAYSGTTWESTTEAGGESKKHGPVSEQTSTFILESQIAQSSASVVDQLSLSLLPPVNLGSANSDTSSQIVTTQHINGIKSTSESSSLWQIHNKYIAVAASDGIIVVDQHVAHERVRFEEVLEELDNEPAASQQLLLPLTLDVNPVEMVAFQNARDLFDQIGFGAREFGATSLIVDSIPSELRNWGDGAVFEEIISDLIEEAEVRPSAQQALAASMACHTSIRAGDTLNQQEMRTLVQRLLNAKEPFSCPHGRPIMIKIQLKELDRLFGRI